MTQQVNNNVATILLIFIVGAIIYKLTAKSRKQILKKERLLGVKITTVYLYLFAFTQLSQGIGFFKTATDEIRQKQLPALFSHYVGNPSMIMIRAYVFILTSIVLFIMGMFIYRLKNWARVLGIAIQYVILVTMIINVFFTKGHTLLWNLPSVLMSIFIIYYLIRPKVKALFSPPKPSE